MDVPCYPAALEPLLQRVKWVCAVVLHTAEPDIMSINAVVCIALRCGVRSSTSSVRTSSLWQV